MRRCDVTIIRSDEPDHGFDIRDGQGRLRARLVRTPDKNFYWLTPDRQFGLGGVRLEDLPLYGCERLRKVPLDVPVVLTEGPKDCDACRRARLVSVGTITGAALVPSMAVLEVLRDRIVVLWPDHDEIGRQHMARIAAALVGVAREIHIVDVDDLPPKAGAADLTAAEIVRLVGRALRRS
jgi:hypothetical protein